MQPPLKRLHICNLVLKNMLLFQCPETVCMNTKNSDALSTPTGSDK